jgi:serine/threonine protein kinase
MATNASRPLLADRYRVLRRLGSGGMGTVLLAEDERLRREVAIKRLPAESPEDVARRFEREARLGASLNHPNIVAIYDTATDDEGVLIVMEYVPGPTLANELAVGPLERERALEVLRGVASALDHAHASGVVHRDVKPANILLGRGGQVKLADLGIATASDGMQITRTGTVLGTPSYMAPEQLEGGALGPAVDVYALAAVAYEALGGQKARPGRTPLEIAHRAATQPPPDLRDAWPEAPPGAAEALVRGMAREPSERPSSAGALVEELAAGLAGEAATESTQAMPATRPAAAPPPQRPAAGGPGPRAPRPPAPRRPAAAPSPQPAPYARSRSRLRWALPAALTAVAGLLLVGYLLLASGAGSDGEQATSNSSGQRTGDRSTTRRTTTATTPSPAPAPDQPTDQGSTTKAPDGAAPVLGGGDDPAQGAELNDQGYALSQQGNDEEAVPILQRAVASFPEDFDEDDPDAYDFALYNLGHSLRASDRPAEAIPYLEKRLETSDYKRGIVQRELALARQQAAGG